MSDDLELVIKKMVADQLQKDVNEIDSKALFVEDLGADSLAVAALVLALEEKYGISISEEDEKKLVNVKSVVKFLKSAT